MGFDAYFLIVSDLCRFAREQGIWYNARGSAAGSMIAYVLQITLVDPLKHDLLFERFLNPGRISMPDIDLDFQDDLRSQVLEYCTRKYGGDKVAQIITFGTMGTKAALRDVGRVMDIPLNEVDRVAKLVPFISGRTSTMQDALAIPEFKETYDSQPHLRELIDVAAKMEGTVRNAGTHAAGVVISDKPIMEYLPLHRPTSGSEETPIKTVTQFEMGVLDSLGMLKVDILGLITLTVMQRACEMIEKRHGVRLHLNNIPLDDPKAFELLGSGQTAGVFQVEGGGMTRYLVQMKPKRLDDIIAMVALYRPGPMQFIPNYIARMHGEAGVEYRHPALAPIFDSTYGIPVYQEQLMRAAVELAGYTPSESDELRSAISKKKKLDIEKHRRKFVAGAVQLGMPRETAEGIFADWEEFARYGFNKSHAADYGVIAVQTAYLKANYPAEYMAALLSASAGVTEKVALYAADARNLGVPVLPPEINASGWDFEIEDIDGKPQIRFGLSAIKNLGHTATELVLAERQTNGPFLHLNDFARRVDLRALGKRGLECLIKVGALDKLGGRIALLAAQERITAVSTNHFRAKESGQLNMFGAATGVEDAIVLPALENPDKRETLGWERELMGIYVSDHPLTAFQSSLAQIVSHFAGQLAEAAHDEKIRVAGLVTTVRPYVTKAGKPMGFVTIEDIQGNIELVLFPRTWEKARAQLTTGQIIVVDGKLDTSSTPPKVLVESLRTDVQPGVTSAELTPSVPGQPADGRTAAGGDPARPPGGVTNNAASEGEPATRRGPAARTTKSPAKRSPEAPPLSPAAGTNETAIPPPPDNFPTGWDTEWQPAFENAASAIQADSPVRSGDEVEDAIDGRNGRSTEAPPVAGDPPRIIAPPLATGAAGGVSRRGDSAQPERPPSLYVPLARDDRDPDHPPKQITVLLRSTGDKEHDRRRIKTIYGTLISFHGRDRFSFHIFEDGRGFLMDFPGETTRICAELLARLQKLTGEETWRVEEITFQ
jgi:DNA polymerase-3 subunit alpha